MTHIDRGAYAVMAALKPSAAKVLIAMLFFPGLHGPVEIADNTGMNRGTVASALINLEKLGFVCRNGRYEAWIITARARQMVLGEGLESPALEGEGENIDIDAAEALEGDVENIDLDSTEDGIEEDEAGREGDIFDLPCSSSSLTTVSSPPNKKTTTTTNPRQGFDPEGLDPEDRALIEQAVTWLREAAVPRRQALAAISSAMAAGWDAAEVSDCVGGWLDYAETPAGETIRAPGRVALARLKACEPAPALAPVATTQDYIRQAVEQRGL